MVVQLSRPSQAEAGNSTAKNQPQQAGRNLGILKRFTDDGGPNKMPDSSLSHTCCLTACVLLHLTALHDVYLRALHHTQQATSRS